MERWPGETHIDVSPLSAETTPTVPVPSVAGLSVEAARTRLCRAGLRVGVQPVTLGSASRAQLRPPPIERRRPTPVGAGRTVEVT